MTPEELSRALRDGGEPFLQKRRWIAGLSIFNIASMGLISLFQIGVLKHVPEPPLPGVDADKVNGSAQAYKLLQTPDAFLAMGSYAATAGLAAMGPPDRAQTLPWAPLAMTGKALVDAAASVKLLIDQPTKYQAYCVWCVLSALATVAVVPLALPEARAAWKRLREDDAPNG